MSPKSFHDDKWSQELSSLTGMHRTSTIWHGMMDIRNLWRHEKHRKSKSSPQHQFHQPNWGYPWAFMETELNCLEVLYTYLSYEEAGKEIFSANMIFGAEGP